MSETDSAGNEGHHHSGLGRTPDRKETHSAPELVRSGHRCDRSAAHSRKKVLDFGRAPPCAPSENSQTPANSPSRWSTRLVRSNSNDTHPHDVRQSSLVDIW